MEITIGGKKIEPKNYTIDASWGERSGTFTFGIDPAAGLDDTVIVTNSSLGGMTGKIVAKKIEPGMTTLDIKFDPPAARGSGVYDPSILPPGVTATTSFGRKITGRFTAASSPTWTIPTRSADPRDFHFGDVVHHHECPEQREMVVRVHDKTVFTVVLDDIDGHRGDETAYMANVLVKVE